MAVVLEGRRLFQRASSCAQFGNEPLGIAKLQTHPWTRFLSLSITELSQPVLSRRDRSFFRFASAQITRPSQFGDLRRYFPWTLPSYPQHLHPRPKWMFSSAFPWPCRPRARPLVIRHRIRRRLARHLSYGFLGLAMHAIVPREIPRVNIYSTYVLCFSVATL